MNLSDAEKEKLVQENIKIIYFVLKKNNLYFRKDELYDIGLIGLVNGINTFDDTKGYKLSTYIYMCIRNEIFKNLRKEIADKRQATVISLNSIIDDEKQSELEDMLGYDPNYDEELIKNEILEKINKRTSLLPKKQYEIVSHLFGLNGYEVLSQRDIAKKYKCSQTEISRTKTKYIRMLKYYLKDYR